jgi:hypothetical protein
MFLKICEFTTGYPSQNDLPVVTVKKNPFKRLFLTKEVGEKRGYLSPRSGKGKRAFNIDNSANHLILPCTWGRQRTGGQL